MTEIAWKLADRTEWEAARATGAYAGSAVDRADGFIHLSTAAQAAETARRHYAGRTNLVLAAVDLSKAEAVKWEASRGGDLFPHLYAPLPFAAVGVEHHLSVDDEGAMRFEDEGVQWP